MEVLENFTVTLHFQVSVDTETGEVITKCVKKSIDKAVYTENDKPKKVNKKVKVEGDIPKLVLEENKYCLNQAAANLMGIAPGDKIDIKYEKIDKSIVPIIGSDSVFGTRGGNKLTQSLTVACRGSKNQELSKYGTEFTIISHKDGLFILKNEDVKLEQAIENNEEFELPDDSDIQELLDNATEVKSSIFQL